MGAIPCKRPKVPVEAVSMDTKGRHDSYAAICRVPICTWGYSNVVKTDVEENAVRHRREHRAAVPVVAVIRSHGAEPYHVECECGFTRFDGTTTTRTDAESVRAHHLSAEHGLVTC